MDTNERHRQLLECMLDELGLRYDEIMLDDLEAGKRRVREYIRQRMEAAFLAANLDVEERGS